MTNRKNKLDARLGRRVRTRLTRVLVMAVAGPVMAGSLAYAAGVEPVRRRVDEFLKGTAGLFKTAESSTRDFHLSPNPSGQGVLVMPLGDRGPRPAANRSTQGSGNKKEESAPSGKSKQKSEAEGRDVEKKATDSQGSTTKSDDSKETSSGSDADGGSGDVSQESHEQEAVDSEYDGWHEGSGDSDDDRSGSNSGSDDWEDDRTGSDSGDSDSKSDND